MKPYYKQNLNVTEARNINKNRKQDVDLVHKIYMSYSHIYITLLITEACVRTPIQELGRQIMLY